MIENWNQMNSLLDLLHSKVLTLSLGDKAPWKLEGRFLFTIISLSKVLISWLVLHVLVLRRDGGTFVDPL